MKKFFSIFAALLFAGSMMAVTLDPGTQTAVTPTNTSTGDPISLTINGIQIDYTGALGAANPTATPPVPADFRVFAGKTLKLTATSNISKVVIAGKANKKDFTATVDKGTVTTGASYAAITEKAELTDPLIVVENINATSVTLTVGKQLRAYMIEVTLGEGEGGETPAVATPVISGNAEFTESTQVTITCATEDAAIYYTLDGSDPTLPGADVYEAQFTLTESATVKAVAIKGEDKSAVATKAFTKKDPAQAVTCVDVYLMAKGDVVDLLNDVTVTYANGKNVWVKDGSAPMLIFLPSDGSYVPGDILSGVAGVVDIYNGVHEIKPTADQVSAITVTKGEAPAAIPVVNIDEHDVNKYIVMEGVQVSGSFQEGTQSNITVNGVVVRNQFKNGYTFAADKLYNIYGVVTLYQSNPQVYFITATEAGDVPGGDQPGGGGQTGEITTCAAAAEAALSVSANNELYNNGASYTITGYVTSIAYAWKEGSMSFWMADTENGGNVLEAYKCAIANEADAVLVGDKVAVTGQLTKYNTTPEFAAGCTVEIIERAEAAQNLGEKTIAEFLALKNTKDTCILTGVVANIQNEEYGNFDLVDETGSVYIYGLLTPEGESKKFADLNVAEKDTLTVLAIYNEYNGNPQVKNAVFVEVKKAAVEPGETIELVFDNGGVDNYYYANYGSTDIQLYNIPVVGGELQGDGDFLQLEIYPADPNDISGEYSIEDEGLDDYYTYLMRVNGTDTTEIEFVAGSITVSVQNPDKENSSADLTVQGQLMTAEGDVYVINSTLNVYYNFTISEEEKYTLDEAEADFNYNFDTYQLMPTGNDIIVGVYAQTNEAVIAATIVLPQGQTELVAGEYEVSVMPMYGTVMAGQYTAEGPQPSFALTNDGKLWYLVSGKVTVEGDGSIVIDALNSNGKAIKSTLDHLQGDGIDEVNAAIKATKTLKNGQLIIEKNGVRYNVNGQRIK